MSKGKEQPEKYHTLPIIGWGYNQVGFAVSHSTCCAFWVKVISFHTNVIPVSLLRSNDFDVFWALFGTPAHFLGYAIIRFTCITVYKKWIREALKRLVKFKENFLNKWGVWDSEFFCVFLGNYFLYYKHSKMLRDIWYYHSKWREMLYLTISWCYGSKKILGLQLVLGLTLGGWES